MNRSTPKSLRRALILPASVLVAATLVSCGRPPLIGGRPYPPDFDGRGYPRAMVAWATNGNGAGRLQLIDVEHDTVNNREDSVHSYFINGYGGTDPLTIQDFPGQQVAYVFADGGGPANSASLQGVSTGTDMASSPVAGIASNTTSAYITSDFQYAYSASPTTTRTGSGYLTVIRAADATATNIPLPAVNKLAPSPGAATGSATLLAFAANSNTGSNDVYQLVGIGQNSIYDCTQQIIPFSAGGASQPFDKPINALYSSDGTSAFVIDCGPECGGTNAGISVVSTSQLASGAAAAYRQLVGCNIDPQYTPAPLNITTQQVNVPGGATVALQLGNTLFVAGQKLYPDGNFGGILTAIDLTNPTATAPSVVIGDGYHFRMRLADDNTLWIAAGGPNNSTCSDGEQAATGGVTGCMTMVPIIANSNGSYSIDSTRSVVIEPTHGNAGGLAPITYYHKIYTVEGGTVFIYSTVDGSAISNVNVQVPGYGKDIVFIDGTSITGP